MRPDLYSIIMAGGSGTRLWPSSRKNYPKQFLNLIGNESFLQQTARRLIPLAGPDRIFVVTDEDYTFNVINQLKPVLGEDYDRLITEPAGRNTAPAIALSVRYLLDQGAEPDTVLFFSPADHIIQPAETLLQAINKSLPAAREAILTFGIVPSKPETGYGYLELGGEIINGTIGIGENSASLKEPAKNPDHSSSGFGLYRVKAFREKPDLKTAREFVDSGNYLWNSGMFMFSIGVILEAFRRHAPALARAIEDWDYPKMVANYRSLPRESIDYAVMEKTSEIVCAPLEIEWNDIGSWDSLYEILPRDSEKNALSGQTHLIESRENLVLAGERLVTLVGVEKLAVIDTPDALLICKRDEAQRVKNLVGELEKTRPSITLEHVTTYRPWGSFTVLEEGPRYKIKRIVVNPGASLSLQRHLHRSEHWVVVSGAARVNIGEKENELSENQSVYVPINQPHRLANPGRIPLEIIEVQNGEYVGEDDIIRLEDHYGRT